MSDRSYTNSNPSTGTGACPHGYPVTITDSSLSSAMRLARQTLAFAWYRYLEWLFLSAIAGTALIAVLGLCVVAYVYVHQYVAGAVLVAGMGALLFLVLPLTDRQAFSSHCGHIAVLTHLIMTGETGNGAEKMFKFGRDFATHKLGDLATIWTVHSAIRGAARQLSRTLDFALPFGASADASFLKSTVHRVINWAMPYVDATVLSYGIARGDRDFGSAGLDALVYAVQNAKSVMKVAIGAWLLEKVILGPVWLVCAAVIGASVSFGVLQVTDADVGLLHQNAREFFGTYPTLALGSLAAGLVVGPLVARLITKSLSEAFVRPTLIAMVLITFHNAVRTQPIDTSLRARIVGANDSLANLSDAATRLQVTV